MNIVLGSRLCHRAKLYIPWAGRPVLRVWFDGLAPSGRVTVQWGNTPITGTVMPAKSGDVVGEGCATIVCGIGWHQEPPAAPLIDAAAAPIEVARQLAGLVGETLTIGLGSIREGRAAYARANRLASETLMDLLATNALWWVTLAGATHTATDRPTSSVSGDLVTFYDPESRRVKLDAEEPSLVPIGATIEAVAERFPVAQRIRELHFEANENGVETWAELAEPTRPLPKLMEQLEPHIVERPHQYLRGATVQSQDAQGRVSLRLEERDKELADPLPVPAWCGTPGVSAEVFSGTRTLLGFDRADPTNPFAALWSPLGQAGHVPNIVRHEAFARIEMVAASAGKVHVGTPTVPVALAPPVDSIKAALVTFAAALGSATTIAQVAAAGTALGSALAAVPAIGATKLEAQ
jgi:hypothetical protein